MSPLAAKDWSGVCPVWFGVGEEMLADEAKCVASWMKSGEGKVGWRQWGGMCHCFGMVLVWTKGSRGYFEEWAGFIKQAFEAGEGGGEGWKSDGKFYEAKSLKEVEVKVEGLAVADEEEVWRGMRESRDARVEGRISPKL